MRTKAFIIATLLAGATAAPAAADTQPLVGGSITVQSINEADDSCVEIPIAYAFPSMPTDWYWNVELASTSTAGAYLYGDGGDAGSKDALWCPADVVGAFTLSGTLHVEDGDANTVANQPVSLSFTVRKRATHATIRTPDHTPKVGKTFHLKGCVTAAAKREDYRAMQIRYRVSGGPWKKVLSTETDMVGCYDEPVYLKSTRTKYVRVVVPATHSREAGYSPTLKLKAHR